MTYNEINLKQGLVSYGKMLVEKYKAQLRIDGTYATGDTANSLDYTISNNELVILADMAMSHIDQGREGGGQPPIQEILNWATAKGIRPKDGSGRFIEINDRTMFRMAANISKAISYNGTIKRFGGKGSGIIDFVYQGNKSDIVKGIFLAYSNDVDNMIEEIIKVK
jgi:hypothetical protein